MPTALTVDVGLADGRGDGRAPLAAIALGLAAATAGVTVYRRRIGSARR